jgi:hypothetical protein
MFGYIKTYSPELKVKENEYYRAVYCGLCRSLGKCTGQASRLTLSYDITFAALLRIASTDTTPKISVRRCIAHPIKKRPMAEPVDELDFCAAIGTLLAYHKLCDDISDEKGGKRFKAGVARCFMSGMTKKARKQISEAENIIIKRLSELSKIEKSGILSVDVPADCFGYLMGELLSLGLPSRESRIMSKIGFHLGRWLYIVDAADDYYDDIKKKRFNPFALLYGGKELTDNERENIFNALSAELMLASDAFDLMEISDGQNEVYAVIRNILYLGMPDSAYKVLYPEKDIK